MPNTFAVLNRNFMINCIFSKSYSLEELSTAITTIILVVNPVLNAIRLRHAQLYWRIGKCRYLHACLYENETKQNQKRLRTMHPKSYNPFLSFLLNWKHNVSQLNQILMCETKTSTSCLFN